MHSDVDPRRICGQAVCHEWAVDGTSEEWSLTRYLDDAIVKDSEEETERFFDQIREFEVGFPSELCQSG